tara:strand:+ start:1946 stop:2674 length:729 start_codon:yes stop_codon:yes gene_type:complete
MADVDVDFIWDAVVIGSEINALRFAAKNKIKILFNCFPDIHSYESLPVSRNSFLEDEWAAASYDLSRLGLVPFADRIKTIRVSEKEKILQVNLKSERVYKIKYKDLYLFDIKNVHGLEKYFDQRTVGYRVLDWFDIRKGGSAQFDDIEDDSSDFVKKITFFKSTRLDASKHENVDMVSESFLTAEQLTNPDFTDTMARLKISRIFEDRDLAIELWKRDVYPIKETIYINKFGDFYWMSGGMK